MAGAGTGLSRAPRGVIPATGRCLHGSGGTGCEGAEAFLSACTGGDRFVSPGTLSACTYGGILTIGAATAAFGGFCCALGYFELLGADPVFVREHAQLLVGAAGPVLDR